MTLGKRSLRPSVHHPEAALCRFYLLTAAAVPSSSLSFVRRIKRRRWCHIRTKPFNQIDYGDSRVDEDGGDGDGQEVLEGGRGGGDCTGVPLPGGPVGMTEQNGCSCTDLEHGMAIFRTFHQENFIANEMSGLGVLHGAGTEC